MADIVYDLGDPATPAAAFALAGVPTDPTTVTATVRKPDGTDTDYSAGSIIHDGVGAYHLELTADQAGRWEYKFVGAGAVNDVQTGRFYVAPDPTAAPPSRDLCTIADVLVLVPGYESDPETDEALQEMITAESQLVHDESGREIVAIPGLNPRVFDVDWMVAEDRELMLGDATTINTVTVKDCNGGVVPTPSTFVALPRIRQEWEPVTGLWFRRDIAAGTMLAWGYTLEVDAVWGFPFVPQFITKAVAKRVLLRYITDVASKGTNLAEAVDDVNPAALFASARDALNRIRIPGVG